MSHSGPRVGRDQRSGPYCFISNPGASATTGLGTGYPHGTQEVRVPVLLCLTVASSSIVAGVVALAVVASVYGAVASSSALGLSHCFAMGGARSRWAVVRRGRLRSLLCVC